LFPSPLLVNILRCCSNLNLQNNFCCGLYPCINGQLPCCTKYSKAGNIRSALAPAALTEGTLPLRSARCAGGGRASSPVPVTVKHISLVRIGGKGLVGTHVCSFTGWRTVTSKRRGSDGRLGAAFQAAQLEDVSLSSSMAFHLFRYCGFTLRLLKEDLS